MTKKTKIFLLTTLICGLCLVTQPAFAAHFFIEGPVVTTQGDVFRATVFLDTADKSINAISATITYPPQSLEVVALNSAQSFITLWSNPPTVDAENGTIHMSGGLPYPGFRGLRGEVVSIVFKATTIGRATVSPETSSEALLNDGLGTKDGLTIQSLILDIQKPGPGQSPATISSGADTTPPSNLQLDIGKDDAMFNGKYFASFVAQDTESGISHYEIAEKKLVNKSEQNTSYPQPSDWHNATSPRALENQSGIVLVFVKAVDKSGNQAVTSKILDTTVHTTHWLKLVALLGTALIIAILTLWLLWRNKKYKNIPGSVQI